MKIFNKLYLLGLILSIGLFNACQEDALVQPEPSPQTPENCQGIFFPKENKANVELDPNDAKTMEVLIARTKSEGAFTVDLNVENNTDDVFEIPKSISFAAGEDTVSFTVNFPDAGEGKGYNLKISVEGEDVVDPYSSFSPFVSTTVTRIKWEPYEHEVVYMDGAFTAFFGVANNIPMYVEAEIAELAEVTKYRFKNVYKVATGDFVGDDYIAEPDEYGIYDGYVYNEPGDFDEDNVYYTVIEVYLEDTDNEDIKKDNVFMASNQIGVDWSYGMITIGSVYGNLSSNIDNYPLGTIDGDKITFPGNSLFLNLPAVGTGVAGKSTTIYLNRKAYEDEFRSFNDYDYELIEGAVSEFESKSVNRDPWEQDLTKAIDIEPDNKESIYKNLYYLPNLYEEDFGLAFYNKDGKITVPNNQNTGMEVFGKEVYVSASSTIESKIAKNAKGVDIYTFGLKFHLKDGTELGDFAETFMYSKDPVKYEVADFVGAYLLTGESQFDGEDPAEMEVDIAEGETENTLIITGVDMAEEIVATFNPQNSTISIAPQELADFERPDGAIWDITLYTTTVEGAVSVEAEMIFELNKEGSLVFSKTTEADGYLLRSEARGGWVDGYYDLEFAPIKLKSALRSVSAASSDVSVKSVFTKRTNKPENNFTVQEKGFFKSAKNNVNRVNF